MASRSEAEAPLYGHTAGNAYSGISASGSARQQNGNITNNYRDDDGLTALHHAVLSGFEDTTQVLINAGSDVNHSSELYGTPLCLAALKARDNAIRLLLEARASVSASGGRLGSAIYCASSSVFSVSNTRETRGLSLFNAYDKLKSLHGIDTSASVLLGPLHIAICNHHTKVAEILMQLGAEVNYSETASFAIFWMATVPFKRHASRPTPLSMAAWFGSIEGVALLLAYRANVSLADCINGFSALMYAVMSGSIACASTLVQHETSLHIQSLEGKTALHLAAERGHLECVELLVDAGAPLELRNKFGSTALMCAVTSGYSDVVSVLLESGADVNTKALSEQTTLDVAPIGVDVDTGEGWIAQELARRGASFSKKSNSYTMIRLLHVEALELQRLAIFESEHPIPEFISLSHTWMSQELTYRALQSFSIVDRKDPHNFDDAAVGLSIRHNKLMAFAREAKRHNVQWIWIDTICIDGENLVEKQAAQNSLMGWHASAKETFIYLPHFASGTPHLALQTREMALCTWFSRSWNLQELLVNEPEKTLFYNGGWVYVGSRASLASSITDAMGIRPEHLKDYKSACVAAKLSWGSHFTAKMPEDRSYAMLGILGVTMELRYGEGESAAFQRLQEAIIGSVYDESLFAWSYSGTDHYQEESGLLAPSIDCFRSCADYDAYHDENGNAFRMFELGAGCVKIRRESNYPPRPHRRHVPLLLNPHPLDITLQCTKRCDSRMKYPVLTMRQNSQGILRRMHRDEPKFTSIPRGIPNPSAMTHFTEIPH